MLKLFRRQVRYVHRRTIFLCEQSGNVLSETYFTLFSHQKCHSKFCALARTFCNVQVPCYCCVTWYRIRTAFSLLYSHLRRCFCGVILLHVARVWTGSFTVPVFVTFLNPRSWLEAYNQVFALGITRPLHTPVTDLVARYAKL